MNIQSSPDRRAPAGGDAAPDMLAMNSRVAINA
jgi:hypothetical protein